MLKVPFIHSFHDSVSLLLTSCLVALWSSVILLKGGTDHLGMLSDPPSGNAGPDWADPLLECRDTCVEWDVS